MKTYLFFLILALLLSCGKGGESGSGGFRTSEDLRTFGYFELMNSYRVSLGLTPLKYLNDIEDVAREHSLWMSQGGLFGHYGWRKRCSELRKKLDSFACGEIVAMGQKTPEAVLTAWINSEPHRESIEKPDWTHTGVSVEVSSSGRHYWTQIFLRLEE